MTFTYNKHNINYTALCLRHNCEIGIFNVFEGINYNEICIKVITCPICLSEESKMIKDGQK